jgi:hypothetical protein
VPSASRAITEAPGSISDNAGTTPTGRVAEPVRRAVPRHYMRVLIWRPRDLDLGRSPTIRGGRSRAPRLAGAWVEHAELPMSVDLDVRVDPRGRVLGNATAGRGAGRARRAIPMSRLNRCPEAPPLSARAVCRYGRVHAGARGQRRVSSRREAEDLRPARGRECLRVDATSVT